MLRCKHQKIDIWYKNRVGIKGLHMSIFLNYRDFANIFHMVWSMGIIWAEALIWLGRTLLSLFNHTEGSKVTLPSEQRAFLSAASSLSALSEPFLSQDSMLEDSGSVKVLHGTQEITVRQLSQILLLQAVKITYLDEREEKQKFISTLLRETMCHRTHCQYRLPALSKCGLQSHHRTCKFFYEFLI